MTKDDLLRDLQAQLNTAENEARTAQQAARDAELRAAFVRGQLDMVMRLTIQPTMIEGSEQP